MQVPTSLHETAAAEMTLWALCLYCGRNLGLQNPHELHPRVRDGNDALEAVASTFDCCRPGGVRLVPTPRTMVSFDRMVR